MVFPEEIGCGGVFGDFLRFIFKKCFMRSIGEKMILTMWTHNVELHFDD